MKEFMSVCPRNCYSTCSFIVQVENNHIKRILPFKGNKATPEGPCIKGLSYTERAHSKNRLTHPLIKKSNGNYSCIPLNDALDIICEKFERIRSRYHPHSILWYKGSGNSGLTNEIGSEFWKLIGGATTTYGNLCWPAGLEAVRLTLGSIKHNVPWDLINAKTIIIWGKNPAETNVQEMAFIGKAKENGTRIVTIDTRRTLTADKSDIIICPSPGTDAALALAVARQLIEMNLTDKEFIKKYVHGFDEFAQNLNLSPEDAEKITGVPSKTLIELARIIGDGPVTFLPGYGLQRHENGGQTIRSLLSLAVITGNIGKKGGGFNYANLQSYIFDKVKEPLSYYPDPEKDDPFRRTISMAKLGTDMLNASDPELKAAWVERGNPLLQSPDSNSVRKAFSKLEFTVVVDQFMTDTAGIADVILPAKDIFEQSDIISSYWSPYIQYKPKVFDPEGDILPESEIYYNLAKKLNISFNNYQIPDPGNDNLERWLEKRISGYADINLQTIKKGPVMAPSLQEIAYSDYSFETRSGKIELFSDQAHKKWGISPLPEYIPVKNQSVNSKYPVNLVTPNTAGRIHSQFGNMEIIKKVTEPPIAEISLIDAEARNILTGCKIRIYNDFGEVITTSRISNRVPKGILSMPNGIWYNDGGGINQLTAPVLTDIGYGAAFHDTMVEFERYDDKI